MRRDSKGRTDKGEERQEWLLVKKKRREEKEKAPSLYIWQDILESNSNCFYHLKSWDFISHDCATE